MNTLDQICASLNSAETSQALLSLVSDAVGIVIVTMKQPEGQYADIKPWTILWESRTVDSRLGYLPSELQQMPLETIIPERFRETHRAYVDDFSAHPEDKVMARLQVNIPARHRSGHDVPCRIVIKPNMFINGDVRLRVAVATLIQAHPGSGGGGCPVSHG